MSELLEFAQRVKEKRQALGISREQLANETRVPPAFIVALEDERHDELPEAVYSNGFLRIISKHLNIDLPTLAPAKINLQTNMASDLFQASKRKHLILPAKKQTFRLISAVLLLLPLAASIVILTLGGRNWFGTTPETTATESVDMPAVTDTTDKVTITAETPAPEEHSVKTAAKISEQQVQLTVQFPTEVQIKIDGKQRAKEILLPRVHIFKFKDESEFIISDTSAISISFNGETIRDLERLGKRRTLVFRSTEATHANY